ncbi:MAG: metallophosphoesterase [Anaerolineae bacterium]
MSLLLIKTSPRLWSIEAGQIMVVTDLHGDWDAYRRYRDRFVDLQASGQADMLLFTGDLIHREAAGQPDHSVEIVLDVLALRATYGEAVICLCGNHEVAHIYGISLTKGNQEYTAAFEAALSQSQRRAEVLALFDALPFYVRTRAGVMLAHAGASAPNADPNQTGQLFNWSHQQLLSWAEAMMVDDVAALRQGYARMQQVSYDVLARHYLAVSGPADPRYNDLLRGFLASNEPAFNGLLWPALFTRCEQEYGQTDYAIFLEALLKEVSHDYFPQQVLIAGHITIRGGYQVVVHRHLRLASAHHATPREAGHYLLFDAAQPIKDVSVLLSKLGTVYK